jgi:hypothetical protein
MNNISPNTAIFAAVLIALAIAAIAWAMVQHQRTVRLKRRFGPEYDVTLSRFRSRAKAEAELLKREERVAGLKLVPITSADAARFSQAWIALQSRFVDNPKGVVAEADLVVRELMMKRGYPMADFEHRAADISVDYPGVVSNYRAAQIIAARDAAGEADTEELRKAVVHYRSLFDELLGSTPVATATPAAARRIPVHS